MIYKDEFGEEWTAEEIASDELSLSKIKEIGKTMFRRYCEPTVMEEIFLDNIEKIHNNYINLTLEEINLIEKIAKKF